jgi:hypothetical protein
MQRILDSLAVQRFRLAEVKHKSRLLRPLERVSMWSNHPFIVMPALVAGIHVFLAELQQGVDGRDKPGHDSEEVTEHDRNPLQLLA